ncbi:MAG: hypothetical protein MJZ81_00235 [Bacteroidales bacterium]|nr:hypothetical protein [Bacteroidales bacterium]
MVKIRIGRLSPQTNIYLFLLGLFLIVVSGSFSQVFEKLGMGGGFVSYRYMDFDPSRASTNLPLGYQIENFVVSRMSDSYLFGTIYSVAVFVICSFLMMRCWMLIGNERRTAWLPLLFWMLCPLVTMTAVDNLLEMPQTMFVLLALNMLLRSNIARGKYHAARIKNPGPDAKKFLYRSIMFDMAAGLSMLMAFVTKGFTGIYLVLFPLVWWFFNRRESVKYPLMDIAVILLSYQLFSLIITAILPHAREDVKSYIFNTLIGGFFTQKTVESHLFILWRLFKQIWLMVLVYAVVTLGRIGNGHMLRHVFYWKNLRTLNPTDLRNARLAWIFIVMGLVTMVPLCITLKQQEYFLITLLPMFAIGVSCYVNSIAVSRLNNITPLMHALLAFVAVLSLAVGCLINLNKAVNMGGSDDSVGEIQRIVPHLEDGETVTVTPEMMTDKVAIYYFRRYKNVHFDTSYVHPHMVSMFHDLKNLRLPSHYKKLEMQSSRYFLYVKEAEEEWIADSVAAVEQLAREAYEDSVRQAEKHAIRGL